MIMDLARTCYSTQATFFRDNPAAATIKWYRAPPGAKVFPSAHKWGQLAWYSYPWQAEGVGENFDAPKLYANGFTPPTAAGQDFFGPLEYFTEGCVFDPLLNVPRDTWGLAVACTSVPDCFILMEPAYDPLILQEDGSGIFKEVC